MFCTRLRSLFAGKRDFYENLFISSMLTSKVYILLGIAIRVFFKKRLHAQTHVLVSTALPVALQPYHDTVLTCRLSDCAYCFSSTPPDFLFSLLVLNLTTVNAMEGNNKKLYLIYRVIFKKNLKNIVNFFADVGSQQQMKTAFNNVLYQLVLTI